jgi:hypothetical protein
VWASSSVSAGKRLNAFASPCAVGDKIFCVAKATTVHEAKLPNASLFCLLLLDLALDSSRKLKYELWNEFYH